MTHPTFYQMLANPDQFFARTTTSAKVLNYGCGDRKESHEVGVDIAATSVTDHVIAPGETLPFSADTFDMAISRYVLEHVNDIFNVLDEIARVLKPGGVYRFVVPHAWSIDACDDPTHVRFFTLSTPNFFVGKANIHYGKTSFSGAHVWLRLSLQMPRFKIIRYPANALLGALSLTFPAFSEQLLKLPFLSGAIYCELKK